ncbi:putative DEAH-box RNA helicase [Leptomonas pyrrhocoris]|uniref:RNA helicase n=1 Tax=Leptomonas pyrrhocoris TaxID=157538 RepID=A0A0N0DVD5_LEPPY|nr:putative DEAH-box RNA helicase [Leptomonas pyrrhocoris]KPA79954.1 putative DEAH-box RNA helicase [Leptomonas pyrrhocoris]|eukprot:XP_015658393.1 putative DEAH-box RNA helicase [Leptomonas pyrrhocoris]
MDREALRKAQQASRAAFLRKAAAQQQKAANAVVEKKLKDVEHGIVPTSLTEAEFLLHRSAEVQAAGELFDVARRRQALGDEGEAPGRWDELASEGQAGDALPASFSALQSLQGDAREGREEKDVPVASTAMEKTAITSSSNALFVAMSEAEIAKRVAAHDYVQEKTFAELQQERAAALQGQKDRLQQQRRSLPIYQMRNELLQLIHSHRVVIMVGETGSGKTTQMLQYLYEEGFHLSPKERQKRATAATKDFVDASKEESKPLSNEGINGEVEEEGEEDELRLICTQPRLIAATSVAERVAQEVGCPCGSVVGYKVRFDDKTGPLTRILYVTDGMMLKEFMNDPDLSTVGAIMVDEAHERSLNTDILLGLLRDVVRRNAQLKVIVASATINAAKFSSFFDNAPVFTVTGRTYPVESFYAEEPVADYVAESAQTVLNLHMAKPLPGDVLVFLPGQDDIETCAETLQKCVETAKDQLRPLLILPIYASLPAKEQARIYERTPPGTRKVVIATNIAETSITIDGVVYVVDCGLCKQDFYDPQAMVEELRVVPTSQASATQRAGRAGRTQAGECYRLFTEYTFRNELPAETTPEILRCSMSAVVLQLKALGIHNLLAFDFLDAPSTASLERAIDHLYLLGAIKADGRLTVTGRRMAEFPMDPSLSKCLIRGCALGCGRHLAMAAAMLTLDSIFINTRDPAERQHMKSAKEHLFGFGNGDVTGYVRLMLEWLRAGPRAGEFCKANCINPRAMLRARDVLDQILRIYDRIGLQVDAQSAKDKSTLGGGEDGGEEQEEEARRKALSAAAATQIDVEAVTKAILSGFFFNVAKLGADKHSYTVVRPMDTGAPAGARRFESPEAADASVVEIHPSSFLFGAGRKPTTPGVRAGPAGGPDAESAIPPALRERPALVVFTQLRHTTKRFMTHVTAVASPEWVLQSAPVNYFQPEELETGLRKRKRA